MDILDSFTFTTQAVQKFRNENIKNLRPNFAYKPLEVIKKTMEAMTQMAKAIVNIPMQQHFASCFKWMNQFHLQETVLTDPVFWNTKDFKGNNMAQIFYGISSRMINMYGMKTEHEFPEIYQDFIQEEGIPDQLHWDNLKAQPSKKVKEIQRE